MRETYQHLVDDDHINAVRDAADSGREPDEDENTLTPETCPTCAENLAPNAKACPNCGEVLTPDARTAQDQLQEAFYEGQKQAQDEEESVAVDALKEQIMNDEELKAELVQELADDILDD